MYRREVSWWEDECSTPDKKLHSYRGTESESPAGTSVTITFDAFGSFTSYSEEDALEVFQKWYDANIKTPEIDLRNEVRKPPVRDGDRDL